jgi:hypothetical protein
MLNERRTTHAGNSRAMTFDFEPVAIEQARKALDEPAIAFYGRYVPVMPPVFRRRPESERDKRLTAESFEWLHDLPRHERPFKLALQFPRIVNKLADIWADHKQTAAYLTDLLVDRRGNRRGFPAAVVGDLLRLRAYQAQQDGASH